MAHLCINRVALTSSSGIIIIILGIFLGWFGFPYALNSNIAKHINLSPDSEAMDRWINIPFPLEFKIYFFNVTNAEDVQNGERPQLQEVGPYVFDLYKTKVNVSYNKKEDTFTYLNKNKYIFNQKKSGTRMESDRLVLINVPLMGTATMVEKLFPMGLSFVNSAIPFLFPNITNMFITATAKEFMYDGILINCSYAVGPAMPVCNGMRGRLPPTIIPESYTKNFKFSFFRHKNETVEGPFKMMAGNFDINKLGQIVEYKNSNNLSMWEANTTCNVLKGTDSTVFAPIVNPDNEVFIYIPDICLSLGAVHTNKTILKDINMYRYESNNKNFADPSIAPENICRCSKNDQNSPPICLKKGAIDAFSCQGAPVVFTQPHFLDADPEYATYPKGLNPDKEKHLTYVLIEPKTGVPVIGKKRMQMNIFLRKIEDITLLANISEGLFPIVWVEEGGEINEESMEKLTDLYFVVNSLDITKWIIIALGIIILFIASILYAKYRMLFCFNGNQVSEFSYGVNTFNTGNKSTIDHTKSTVFNSTVKDEINTPVESISNKLFTESKTNDNMSNTILTS